MHDIVCPICRKKGQLKFRKRGKRWYAEVDHYKYKGGMPHGTWVRSCYLGRKYILDLYMDYEFLRESDRDE